MKIVVSRYNENVEFTKQFPNVIIYNKGPLLGDVAYDERILPNVGREGHTYYQYIYDNYDNLDDYTIFIQGYPFDHSPNIINQINKYITNPSLDISFEFLSDQILSCNLTGCNYHSGIPLRSVYAKLFNNHTEELEFIFGAGAQFIVSKQQIISRPREFYLQIVQLLQYDIHPIEGFVIERFHQLIFS